MKEKLLKLGIAIIVGVMFLSLVLIRWNVTHYKRIVIEDGQYNESTDGISFFIDSITTNNTMDISVNDSGYFGKNVDYKVIEGYVGKNNTSTTIFNTKVLLKVDSNSYYSLSTEMVDREDLSDINGTGISWEKGGFKAIIKSGALSEKSYPIYILYETEEETYLINTGIQLEM